MSRRIRMAIAGMDHWYTGFNAGEAAKNDPRVDLVVVAHRDAEKAAKAAAQFGAAEHTTDYTSVVQRNDIDLVVTTCPTRENPELVIAAAQHGMHIASVKPMANTMAEADAMVEAVEKAVVSFLPLECQMRLSPLWRQVKAWYDEGKIGRLLSSTVIQRGQVPLQDWPGRHVDKTWWIDPQQVFGGGWLDHAIYSVDIIRWILGEDVVRISGEINNIKHPHLDLEDFGAGTLVYTSGAVASVEVTWAGVQGAHFGSYQFVGTEGQIISGNPFVGNRLATAGIYLPASSGWVLTDPPRGSGNWVSHYVDHLLDGKQLVAGIEDGRKSLTAMLAFYKSAGEHKTVTLNQ